MRYPLLIYGNFTYLNSSNCSVARRSWLVRRWRIHLVPHIARFSSLAQRVAFVQTKTNANPTYRSTGNCTAKSVEFVESTTATRACSYVCGTVGGGGNAHSTHTRTCTCTRLQAKREGSAHLSDLCLLFGLPAYSSARRRRRCRLLARCARAHTHTHTNTHTLTHHRVVIVRSSGDANGGCMRERALIMRARSMRMGRACVCAGTKWRTEHESLARQGCRC